MIYSTGFAIVLTDAQTALKVPQASPQPAALHFVGVEVEYVAAALAGPAGEQIAGVRVKVGDVVTTALADYSTTTQMGTAISVALTTALANYLPLSEVTTAATASKASRRNVDGELVATKFRGVALRSPESAASVSLEADNGAKGIEVTRSFGGAPMVGLFGHDPDAQPVVDAAAADQAVALRDALAGIGAIAITAGTPMSTTFSLVDYSDRQTDLLPWNDPVGSMPGYPYVSADLTEVADAVINASFQLRTGLSVIAKMLETLGAPKKVVVTT